MAYTLVDDIPKIIEALRSGFRSGKTRPIAYRKEQLKQLGYVLQENTAAFLEALKSDLGRPHFESEVHEIIPTLSAVKDTYNNVAKWARTESAPFNPVSFSMHPKVIKDPKGTVLVIVPFNLPVMLSFIPLMGAIAAGNTVLVKPSELAPATSQLLAELIAKYLDPDVVRVVQGGVEETSKILELQWDHIVYTGGPRVARIISAAAAKHLTPLTLELGGKSPVIIDPKSDLRLAARRIWWAKLVNAGQICVAPDYVLVPREIRDQFIKEVHRVHAEFFPNGAETSNSYSRIVTKGHADRLAQLIQKTEGVVVIGGEVDVEQKYIAPTIILDPSPEEPLMKEEIFGPILPVISVQDVDEAIEFVNARDHPLALYVFSQDSGFRTKVAKNTQSGAFVCNELLFHVAAYGLPLGGTGPSGYGQVRGKFGFDTFTHFRASIDQAGWVDTLLLWRRYAPYNQYNQKFLSWVTGDLFPDRARRSWKAWLPPIVATIVGVVGAVVLI
ncbi:aldehyde dehydrogenase [Cristinia sonorae]|uniref:Aldehyde dehydrogenase n=1 Tax=Cristinia sonorae TaxID=1940300 RepID=A0A8K0XKR5_9AGAR|nr:aldehyde dehydrogenase [Cristinia sonorae]